jgi:hypothetical protein
MKKTNFNPSAFLPLAIVTSVCHADDDVVRRLELLTHRYVSIVTATPPKIEPPNKYIGDWYRRKIYIQKLEYDVQKTSSLVSPFVGEISYNCSVKGKNGSTRAAVSYGPNGFDEIGAKCLAKYAFQKGKWVKKTVLCRSNYVNENNEWVEPIPENGASYDCASLLPKTD